jgi:hypothetical protein
MQRTYQYETGSHPRVQEQIDPMDAVSDGKTSHDVLHTAIRFSPVLLEQSQAFPQVANVRSVDPELLYNEDKLGCARGVIWAFVFEAALIVAIAIFWKLHFFWR